MRIYVDLETYLITDNEPFPKPVCLTYTTDTTDPIVLTNYKTKDICDIEKFLLDNLSKHELIWQNGMSFDLPVIWTHFPSCRELLIKSLDTGLHKDTLIRQKLYDLSTDGRIKNKRGSYSLANLYKIYGGEDVTQYKQGDDIWRLRYNELDNLPIERYPAEAIKYCKLDVEILKRVFLGQEKLRQLRGPGSINTEDLQIKTAFVLSLMSSIGMKVDLKKLYDLELDIQNKLKPLQEVLLKNKFATITKKGLFRKCDKELREYLQNTYKDYIKKTNPTKTHPRGQIELTYEALNDYPEDSIIQARKDLILWEKYFNTYCKNIRKYNGTFKESYDILKETGRTSSFTQTMPKEGGIRELFIPRKNYTIIAIDFSAIEACSIAQAMVDLNLGATLKKYLNLGIKPKDYHSLLGHMWYAYRTNTTPNLKEFNRLIDQKNYEAIKARTDSKPGGLSIAGGVGNATMQKIAKASGVNISEEDAGIFREFAYNQIPEIKLFLGNSGWVGKQILSEDQEYPYAYEVNGRYRNRCTYCACANGRSMQSPAADGAKEAIWEVFKYIYEKNIKINLLAFIHDELLFEVNSENLKELKSIATDLSILMCKGMRKILPDIRITTEWSIMNRWTKDESQHLAKGKCWLDETGGHCGL